MLTEQELAAMRRRNGMVHDDDQHARVVAAVEEAARRCGIRSKAAVAAVAGAVLGEKMVKVDADGSIAWTGSDDGWTLETALPGFLRRPDLQWIRERDRELAGEVAPDTKDAKAALAARLAAALGAGPAPTMTRAALGEALANTL